MTHYKVNKLRFMRRAKEGGLSRGKITRLRNAFHRAVRESNRSKVELYFCNSSRIDGAFDWSKTVQGHTYWQEWARTLRCEGWE